MRQTPRARDSKAHRPEAKIKLGLSFYYVGDLKRAAAAYAHLLGSQPSHAESGWIRFSLAGGELALHLDPRLEPTHAFEPMRFGAVVSFDVESMDAALRRATEAGFALVGEVQVEAYGKQAEVRDPWGNRLSFVERPPRADA